MSENTNTPETDPTEPKKKAAKAPRKKAEVAPAVSTDANEAKARSLYLPALPDDFAYTSVVATGPKGETITVTPIEGGKASLAFEGAGLKREQEFDDMATGLKAAAKAAKAMADVAKREAELARVREEAFVL